MAEYERLKISKLEAARRQLDCALELWFLDKDPLSVHTLVAAAHQILHDLNQKRDGPELIFDSIIIRDECRRDFIDFAKRPGNFLKHAHKDPDNILEFVPFGSMMFFTISVFALQSFGLTFNRIESAFVLFTAFHHPTWISEEVRIRLVNSIPVGHYIKLGKLKKQEFFEAVMQLKINE